MLKRLVKRVPSIFLNFISFLNIREPWSPYLEIEILRHIVSNPPINSDTKSNSCNSRVGVRGEQRKRNRLCVVKTFGSSHEFDMLKLKTVLVSGKCRQWCVYAYKFEYML